METKDRNGTIVKQGMNVMVVGVPELPDYLIEESLPVFEWALGRVFSVYAVDDHGQTWIEAKGQGLVGEHTIGLEPEHVEVIEI